MNQKRHPVNDIHWVPHAAVAPNDYNPNSQAEPSLKLLMKSIEADGFTQPIVVRPPNRSGVHIIVDGEHRWRAAALLGMDQVPVAVLKHRRKQAVIAATVRHNRAKGAHSIQDMYKVVASMRRSGLSTERIADDLGMSGLEIERLETSEKLFLAIKSGQDALM